MQTKPKMLKLMFHDLLYKYIRYLKYLYLNNKTTAKLPKIGDETQIKMELILMKRPILSDTTMILMHVQNIYFYDLLLPITTYAMSNNIIISINWI